MQSETLRVYVLNAKFSALNFTSMKFVVAELSSQTLRGLRELCEALNSDESEVRGCEAFVSNALRPTPSRTSDRAGRARAPTHAHPVFDDKISTPTRPARAKKRNGRPPTHWASASATRPPARPKGKRLKVVEGARPRVENTRSPGHLWSSNPGLATHSYPGYH